MPTNSCTFLLQPGVFHINLLSLTFNFLIALPSWVMLGFYILAFHCKDLRSIVSLGSHT